MACFDLATFRKSSGGRTGHVGHVENDERDEREILRALDIINDGSSIALISTRNYIVYPFVYGIFFFSFYFSLLDFNC